MPRAWRTRTCVQCDATFLSYPGDPQQFHKCRGKGGMLTIELSAEELKRLSALATLRGVSVAELARAELSEYAGTEAAKCPAGAG